jgi:preprotein translocase subunit SecA
LVLQVLDAAWKDHLLALDRLRSSVRLRRYARVDPIVEYKQEGMRMFSQMWDSVGERITDQVFRMQHFEERSADSPQMDDEAPFEDISLSSDTSEHE